MAEESRSVQDRKPNRLITEKSPYLLQHAHNPVDWYPWGPEAFATAAQRDLPVLLSVGYATCHWCHVMERESFEDPEVAALMNENLVPVKVDREERPDIDGIYMTVCQMMTGSGGWPLTIVMTPDKKPFFAGTYLPKQTMAGRVGMVDLIRRIRVLWTEKRQEVERFAGDVTASLIESEARSQTGGTLEASVFSRALDDLSLRFDPEHGGFSHAPKFPTPQHCLFLFRYWLRYRDSRCLAMAERTLTAMRLGGIWDHLGGGFHRYSTDRHWLVPHFEKMLYDQALLCIAYLEAFQVTGKDLYAETVRDLLDYVLRDMTSQEGGFFSAEDADSEGEEGKFYVWRTEEIDVLLAADAPLFREVYGISGSGNFRDEATGEAAGANILYLRQDLSAESRERGTAEDSFTQKMAACRTRLLQARHQRIRPLKDDKILADWNGLMISAFARAYQVLGDDRYLVAARRAADFLLSRMQTGGRLLHRYREGEAAVPGHADDYAFVIAGLLDLYETSFSLDYLREAISLHRVFLDRFGDHREGGFFFTADDAEELIVRMKEVYDGALPSANSVALLNLLRLSRMTGDSAPAQEAERVVAAFSASVAEHPAAYGYFLCSLDFLFGPSAEIVLSGRPGSPEIAAMAAVVRRHFLPNKILLFRPDIPGPDIVAVAPFTAAQTPVKGSATAYICRNFTCADPVTDPESMLRLLGLPSQAP